MQSGRFDVHYDGLHTAVPRPRLPSRSIVVSVMLECQIKYFWASEPFPVNGHRKRGFKAGHPVFACDFNRSPKAIVMPTTKRHDRVCGRANGGPKPELTTDTTEFQSLWPVVNAPFNHKCISSSSTATASENNENHTIGGEYEEDEETSSEIKLAPENIAFNTNARNQHSRDRLRQLFTERHSHKALSEQKVSDWLLRYRSYFHCSPKDLSDIPDSIWAPLDIAPSTKNTNDSEVIDVQGHNAASAASTPGSRRNIKFNLLDSFEQTAPVVSTVKSKEPTKRRYHSIATDRRPAQKPSTVNLQIPYFFQPPYRISSKSLKQNRGLENLGPLRKSENYMDVSRGLLRASRMPE